MILVTGPTGSGKTVTLYTALNILNTTEYGILVPVKDTDAMKEGIEYFMQNPSYRIQCKKNVQKRIKDYNHVDILSQYSKVIFT